MIGVPIDTRGTGTCPGKLTKNISLFVAQLVQPTQQVVRLVPNFKSVVGVQLRLRS